MGGRGGQGGRGVPRAHRFVFQCFQLVTDSGHGAGSPRLTYASKGSLANAEYCGLLERGTVTCQLDGSAAVARIGGARRSGSLTASERSATPAWTAIVIAPRTPRARTSCGGHVQMCKHRQHAAVLARAWRFHSVVPCYTYGTQHE